MRPHRARPRTRYTHSWLVVLLVFQAVPSPAVTQNWNLSDPTSLIEQLIGTWRFELYGSAGEQPTAQGTRTFERFVPDQPSLLWNEYFYDRAVTVRGLFGYDTTLDRFVEVGVSSLGDFDHLIGEVSTDENSVHWFDAADTLRARVSSLDFSVPGQFTYTSERFRAVFRRMEEPQA